MPKIYFSLLLIVSFCFYSQENKIESFEYVTRGRGVFKQIIIEQDSTFIRDLETENKTMTKSETWIYLTEIASQKELKKLNLLVSPTEKRFSDQALSARLLIRTNSSEYISNEFDHGHPPEEIKKIVEELWSHMESE